MRLKISMGCSFLARRDIQAAAFFAGFASLLYETYVLHVIFIYIPRASQYAALSVAGFLAGMGVAAYLITLYVRRFPQRARQAIIILNIAAILACAFLYRDHQIFAWFLDSWPGSRQTVLWSFYLNTIVFSYAFIPAFCLGGIFPVLNGFFVETRESAGIDTGRLYFMDLAGSVAGAIVTGFYLIPWLGLSATLMVAALTSICLAAMMVRVWLAYMLAVTGLCTILLLYEFGFNI